MSEHRVHFHTVLVGSAGRAEEMRRERGFPHAEWAEHTTVVKTTKGLKGVMHTHPEASVVFLRDWQTLEYGRRIYNACLSNGWAQPWRRP